jgi:predicted nucleotidyltransferase
VILVGSRAKGMYGLESDIAVVSDTLSVFNLWSLKGTIDELELP